MIIYIDLRPRRHYQRDCFSWNLNFCKYICSMNFQMSYAYRTAFALSSSIQVPKIKLLTVRHLWAAATVVSKSGSLSEHLDMCFSVQPAELCASPDICILATSRSYSAKETESIPALISNKINPKLFLGCIADRIHTNTSSGSGVAILLGKFAGENTVITPFFIGENDKTRKKMRSVSVGRWGRPEDFRPRSDQKDFGLDRFRSLSTALNEVMLPEGLKKLNGSTEPSLLFMMSDSEPHQLLETLDQHFPSSHKLGLIAASTPFITGRPYTLFVNDTVVSGGIYGFAVSSHNSISTKLSSPELNHMALVPFGDPMKITNCRGNIILELNDSSATNYLLESLNSTHSLTKEKEYYLGLYPHEITELMDPDMMICRITSGDPSKGNMAVDTTKDLKVGQFVQFMQRNENCKFQVYPSLSGLTCVQAFLSMSDRDQTLDLVHNDVLAKENGTEVCRAVFGASSENGFIVGRGWDGVRGGDSWVCEVPFSRVNFIFN